MYKIIVKLATVFVFLFVISACSEDFLEVENKNQLTDGSFYQTQNDFLLALNSLYTPIAHVGMYGLRAQLLFRSFEDRVLFESEGLDRISVNSSNEFINSMYSDLYKGVFRTNAFVLNLNEKPEIEGMSDDMRREYMAQARALRAMYNFNLVTIFNRPSFYDEVTMPVDFTDPPFNSEPGLFWDLIKADLEYAKDNLPLSWGADDLGRVTSGGAASLLGKAMLYKHFHYYVKNGQKGSAEDLADLRVARDAFLQVIDSGVYSLVQPKAPKSRNDYIFALASNTSFVTLTAGANDYPSENNKESIWEIQYSDERIQNGWLPGWQWTGALNFQYFSAHPDSYRNHEVHPDLWDAHETEGAPAGFDRDPRAYGTMFIDGDTMDYRPESAFFNRKFRAGINNKRIARTRGYIPTSDNPYPTNGFGLRKYSFPIYEQKDSPRNDPFNRRVIRYADVLLMYAEITYLLQENVADGLAKLNEVRARVDMPAIPALTAEAIIHERDIELALEGHRWHDLIRWSFDAEWGIDMNQLLSRQTADGDGSFFVKGKHEYMPIPLYEINLSNGKMEQNPGW